MKLSDMVDISPLSYIVSKSIVMVSSSIFWML